MSASRLLRGAGLGGENARSAAGARASFVTPERTAAWALLAHFAWALWIGFRHPGLEYEADRVANWLYFEGLRSGATWFAEFPYFPAPKILSVFLLGPFAEGPIEMLLVAAIAAGLAASVTWIVARSFGAAAGVATAVLLGLDPRWRELVAVASADLFVAAGVAAAVVAWAARRERLSAVAILLATLAKPPAALAAVPLLFDRTRTRRVRAMLVLAGGVAVAMTVAGYALLLGNPTTPGRFLGAYTDFREDVPGVLDWIGRWMVDDLGGELLPWIWPLAVFGLVETFRRAEARPMRQWLAASAAVATGFAILAVLTRTLLFARFLWSLELCAIAACAIGAIVAGRAAGRAVREWLDAAPARGMLAGALVSIPLLAFTAADLVRSASGPGGYYVVLFDHGARTAVPWLRRLASEIRPGQRVAVPLWYQPAAIWLLRDELSPSEVEAQEVEAERGPAANASPDWLLLAPTYVENAAARRWANVTAHGYERVASSDLPRMSLYRRPPDRRAAQAEPAP